MAFTSSSLLLFLCVLTPLCRLSEGMLLGGQKEIADLNDPVVKEVSSFALNNIDMCTPGDQELVRVVGGTSQVRMNRKYESKILKIIDIQKTCL